MCIVLNKASMNPLWALQVHVVFHFLFLVSGLFCHISSFVQYKLSRPKDSTIGGSRLDTVTDEVQGQSIVWQSGTSVGVKNVVANKTNTVVDGLFARLAIFHRFRKQTGNNGIGTPV